MQPALPTAPGQLTDRPPASSLVPNGTWSPPSAVPSDASAGRPVETVVPDDYSEQQETQQFHGSLSQMLCARASLCGNLVAQTAISRHADPGVLIRSPRPDRDQPAPHRRLLRRAAWLVPARDASARKSRLPKRRARVPETRLSTSSTHSDSRLVSRLSSCWRTPSRNSYRVASGSLAVEYQPWSRLRGAT